MDFIVHFVFLKKGAEKFGKKNFSKLLLSSAQASFENLKTAVKRWNYKVKTKKHRNVKFFNLINVRHREKNRYIGKQKAVFVTLFNLENIH
jgi:hypothetical protein